MQLLLRLVVLCLLTGATIMGWRYLQALPYHQAVHTPAAAGALASHGGDVVAQTNRATKHYPYLGAIALALLVFFVLGQVVKLLLRVVVALVVLTVAVPYFQAQRYNLAAQAKQKLARHLNHSSPLAKP